MKRGPRIKGEEGDENAKMRLMRTILCEEDLNSSIRSIMQLVSHVSFVSSRFLRKSDALNGNKGLLIEGGKFNTRCSLDINKG